MHTHRNTVLAAVALLAAAVVGGMVCKPVLVPASAQVASGPPHPVQSGAWVHLNSVVGNSPFPQWVNLERADTIYFGTTNYNTRQNVPQATVSVGRDSVTVIDPHDIALLRRYVLQRQLH